MAGRSTDSEKIIISAGDAALRNHDGFNSNATGSGRFTILLKGFYGLRNSCNAALNLAIKLKDSIWEAIYHQLNREQARGFFKAFHNYITFLLLMLVALIGFHPQGLGISPLKKHFADFLVFIVATIVYGIAYMGINLQPQRPEYLLRFRLISLVSGIVAVEILISIIISPRWQFMVTFLPILIVGVLCSYKQIYQFLYHTANLIFNAVPSLLKRIYQLVLQIFQSGAFQAFSSREREDNDNQGPGNV